MGDPYVRDIVTRLRDFDGIQIIKEAADEVERFRDALATTSGKLMVAEAEIERLRRENEQLRNEWQNALIDASILRDQIAALKGEGNEQAEDGDVELAEFRAWKNADAMPRTTKVEGGYKHEWIDADGVPHAYVSSTDLRAALKGEGDE